MKLNAVDWLFGWKVTDGITDLVNVIQKETWQISILIFLMRYWYYNLPFSP